MQKLHLAVRNLLEIRPERLGATIPRVRALSLPIRLSIALEANVLSFSSWSMHGKTIPNAEEEHLDNFTDTNGNGVGAWQRGQRVNRRARPVRRQETG
jgi:hypothetical protein